MDKFLYNRFILGTFTLDDIFHVQRPHTVCLEQLLLNLASLYVLRISLLLIKLLLLLLLDSHCFPICWRSDVFGALAVVPSWFYRKLARSKAEKYPDSLEELFTLQNTAKLRVIGYKVS